MILIISLMIQIFMLIGCQYIIHESLLFHEYKKHSIVEINITSLISNHLKCFSGRFFVFLPIISININIYIYHEGSQVIGNLWVIKWQINYTYVIS